MSRAKPKLYENEWRERLKFWRHGRWSQRVVAQRLANLHARLDAIENHRHRDETSYPDVAWDESHTHASIVERG